MVTLALGNASIRKMVQIVLQVIEKAVSRTVSKFSIRRQRVVSERAECFVLSLLKKEVPLSNVEEQEEIIGVFSSSMKRSFVAVLWK